MEHHYGARNSAALNAVYGNTELKGVLYLWRTSRNLNLKHRK
jgi:hypothetical protein